MADRYLIAGLGNPGKKYENTRHNIGFMVVDELARRWNAETFKKERKAHVADATIKGNRTLLVKPQTFMNNSGQALRALVDFYKIEVKNVIVAYDELDIDLGTLRLRPSGSAGGQNGIKSVLQHLGTQSVQRVRCGISRPPGRMDAAAYVLQPFLGDEAITAQLVIDRAASAIETWLSDGFEIAMNHFNGSVEETPRLSEKDNKVTE